MQCPKCNVEYSDSVIELHIERCDEVNQIESASDSDSELDALRERAKELGIENADRKGEKRLREEITKSDADAELKALREQAAAAGIEKVEEKDAETLRSEIAAKGAA